MRVDVLVPIAPGELQRSALSLPVGSTVALALAAAAVELPAGAVLTSYGRQRLPSDVLVDGDRIEVCLPLKADPKLARRRRARIAAR